MSASETKPTASSTAQLGWDPASLPEAILAFYDRDLRRRYWVSTTPAPLVTFAARAVHELVETRSGLPSGRADPSVQVLKPAACSANFPRSSANSAATEPS